MDYSQTQNDAMHRYHFDPMFRARCHRVEQQRRLWRLPVEVLDLIVNLHLSDLAVMQGFTYESKPEQGVRW